MYFGHHVNVYFSVGGTSPENQLDTSKPKKHLTETADFNTRMNDWIDKGSVYGIITDGWTAVTVRAMSVFPSSIVSIISRCWKLAAQLEQSS